MDRLSTSLARALAAFGTPGHAWLTFASVLLLLLVQLAPVQWAVNELNYFDLAWRFVAPERFPAGSAVFDQSQARLLSFALLGSLIELFGADAALMITRCAIAVGFALALTALARAWSLSAAEVLGGVTCFLILGQNYFASEFIFDAVEAKSFAYASVLAATAFLCRRKAAAALLWMGLATYFHFLVGGFWTVALFGLALLAGEAWQRVAWLFGYYLALVAPLLALLVHERVFTGAPGGRELDASLPEIYAVFRNSHHVAPFIDLVHFGGWVPGVVAMLGASFLIAAILVPDRRIDRALSVWLLSLHGYLIVSLGVAFLDRHTHLLAPLYLFRPNALTLLLLLLILAHWLRRALAPAPERTVAAFALAVAVMFAAPELARVAYAVTQGPKVPALMAFEDEDAEALFAWLKANTAREDVVVLEPTPETDSLIGPWVGFERAIERPTLVNYKFVPTAKPDLVRWYRLIQWRQAVFRGDCGRLDEQPVDYLVTVQAATRERLAACGRVLWTRGDYAVIGDLG